MRDFDEETGPERRARIETEEVGLRRYYSRRYALSALECAALMRVERPDLLLAKLDAWRAMNGGPAESSPLSRGYLIDLVRSGRY